MSIDYFYYSVYNVLYMTRYTEAQKRAVRKYETEKVDNIHFTVPKGKREIIKKVAQENGESVNGMLNRLVNEEIEKHR